MNNLADSKAASEVNVYFSNETVSQSTGSTINDALALDRLDKEKLAIKEVSEILTHLPEIASANNNIPVQSNVLDDVHKENSENSSNEDSSSASSDNEDDESEAESSGLDDEASTSLKHHCIGEMSLIEKQFVALRDRLHKERQSQIARKTIEVECETAPEYLQQLQILQQQKEAKLQVAQALRDLRKQSLEVRLKADKLANSQHLSNEKRILKGKIQADLDEKIRRLEEDRNNVDTDYWLDPSRSGGYDLDKKGRKKKKEDVIPYNSSAVKRRRKPVTVTGPYIVYMLKDSEIVDDWAAIKRAVNVNHRTNFKSLKKRHLRHCRYDDGKFYWNGKVFMKGQNIVIKKIMQTEVKFIGSIVNLSATEILIRQNNGKKSKLHVHLLQRGKYSIQHR